MAFELWIWCSLVFHIFIYKTAFISLQNRKRAVLFVPSRGSDREGEWREHHWEDLLPGDSLDPEQVRHKSFCSLTASFHKSSNSHHASQPSDVIEPFSFQNVL